MAGSLHHLLRWGLLGRGWSARSTWELEGGGGGTQAGPGGRVPKGWTQQLPGEQGGPDLEEACLPGPNAWWGDPSFPGDGAVPLQWRTTRFSRVRGNGPVCPGLGSLL